jgi:hypothetical protein
VAKLCPELPVRECFNCGALGHIGKECSVPPHNICFKCQRQGHKAANCPIYPNVSGSMGPPQQGQPQTINNSRTHLQ